MNIFKDIYYYINCLNFVDVIFLVAIVSLIILIVTLIYFIKINKDVLTEDDLFKGLDKSPEKKEDIVEKIINENTKEEVVEEYNDEEGELLDLEGLTKKLKEEENNNEISINKYEQEQEEKAIISYEELLKKNNKYKINYEKEEVLDDLVVKKVNLNDLINKNEKEEVSSNVQVISYEKEEAFLKALKELNSLLS